MVTGLYIAFGLIQLGCIVWGLRMAMQAKAAWPWMVLAPILFMPYDNSIIGLGAFIGEGPTLESLNLPRYVAHALLTPLWLIGAGAIGRRMGVRWLQGRIGIGAMCTLAVALIALSVWNDLSAIELEPERWAGTLRYVNEGHILPGPPIPSILTIVMMIAVGIGVWSRGKWPWMLAGAVFMFLAAGAQSSPLGPISSSAGEVALAIALLATIPQALRGAPAPAAELRPAAGAK